MKMFNVHIAIFLAIFVTIAFAKKNEKVCTTNSNRILSWVDSRVANDSMTKKIKLENASIPSLCLITDSCTYSFREKFQNFSRPITNSKSYQLKLMVSSDRIIKEVRDVKDDSNTTIGEEIRNKFSSIPIKSEFANGEIQIVAEVSGSSLQQLHILSWKSNSDTAVVKNMMRNSDSLNNRGVRMKQSLIDHIEKYRNAMQDIYQDYMNSNQAINGYLQMKFTISASGDVIAVSIADSNISCDEFKQEIIEVFKLINFGRINFGNVTPTYKLNFNK